MTRHLQIAWLLDRKRLHLQDGPIDLILEAAGCRSVVDDAYTRAISRFDGLLDELCAELPALRSDARRRLPLKSKVAQRMQAAVMPFATDRFITPMAAVAGAVAEEIMTVMIAGGGLDRAYVNNGGDIALYLSEGTSFTVGLVDRPDHSALAGHCTIASHHDVRGVATSGAPGRSFSLGIADAVTVLAATASQADAAATVVANAVDLPGHPAVERRPAHDIQPDSDLGERLVTRSVGRLSSNDIATALSSGLDVADELLAKGLITAAALQLRGHVITVGLPEAFARPNPAQSPLLERRAQYA